MNLNLKCQMKGSKHDEKNLCNAGKFHCFPRDASENEKQPIAATIFMGKFTSIGLDPIVEVALEYHCSSV